MFCGGKKVIKTKFYKLFTFTALFGVFLGLGLFFFKDGIFSYTSHWLYCPIATEAYEDFRIFLQLNDTYAINAYK